MEPTLFSPLFTLVVETSSNQKRVQFNVVVKKKYPFFVNPLQIRLGENALIAYLLSSKPSLHTWKEFLHQTSVLRRIVLGLAGHIEVVMQPLGPQMSLDQSMLDSASCWCSHRSSHQNSLVFHNGQSD